MRGRLLVWLVVTGLAASMAVANDRADWFDETAGFRNLATSSRDKDRRAAQAMLVDRVQKGTLPVKDPRLIPDLITAFGGIPDSIRAASEDPEERSDDLFRAEIAVVLAYFGSDTVDHIIRKLRDNTLSTPQDYKACAAEAAALRWCNAIVARDAWDESSTNRFPDPPNPLSFAIGRLLGPLEKQFGKRPRLNSAGLVRAADPLNGALARLRRAQPSMWEGWPGWVRAQFEVAGTLQMVDPGDPEATLAIRACVRHSEWLVKTAPNRKTYEAYEHRRRVASEWLKHGAESVTQPLVRTLLGDGPLPRRERAAACFEVINGGHVTTQNVTDALDAAERAAEVRPLVARFLAAVAPGIAATQAAAHLPRVITLIGDPNPKVQLFAVRAASRLLWNNPPDILPSAEDVTQIADRFTKLVEDPAADGGVRAEAVRALQEVYFPTPRPRPGHVVMEARRQTTIDTVTGALKTPDRSLRLAAAEFLGKCQKAARPAVPGLMAAMPDADPELVKELAGAVLRIGPTAAEAPALLAAGHRLSGQARGCGAAVSVLGLTGWPLLGGVAAYTRAGEPRPETGLFREARAVVTAALIATGDLAGDLSPAAIDYLEATAPSVLDQDDRGSLIRLKDAFPKNPKGVGRVLVALLTRGEHEAIRIEAAHVLWQLGPEAGFATAALGATLTETKSPALRKEVVIALARVAPGDRATLEHIRAELNWKDPAQAGEGQPTYPTRGAALLALQRLKAAAAPAVWDVVAVMRERPDWEVRAAGARTLGAIDREGESVEFLISLIRSEEQALAGDRQPVRYVKSQSDERIICEIRTIEALGQMKPQANRIAPVLVNLLDVQLEAEKNSDIRDDAERLEDPMQKAVANALAGFGESAVTPLIAALKSPRLLLRAKAANVLGRIGAEAAPAIRPLADCIRESGNDIWVAQAAGVAIGEIARVIPDVDAVRADLEYAEKAMTEARSDLRNMVAQAREEYDRALETVRSVLRRPKPIPLPVTPWWVWGFLWVGGGLVAAVVALVVAGRVRPLTRLRFAGWLPGRWVYAERVLDAWVAARAADARDRLEGMPAFRRHPPARDGGHPGYLPIPARLVPAGRSGGRDLDRLRPDHLAPELRASPTLLVISGEGGSGKTTLACDLARRAIDPDPARRALPHRAIPVFLDADFPPSSEPHEALLAAVAGGLRSLIAPDGEEVPRPLLRRLLQARRVLVVVDRLSELSPATRAALRPGAEGFPANALVVTSRADERLDDVSRTSVVTLPFFGGLLRDFMDACYRGYTGGAGVEPTDADRATALAHGTPTPLVASLYVRFVLVARGNAVRTLPELVRAFVTHEYQDVSRTYPGGEPRLLADLRAVAWECVRVRYRSGSGRRDDVLRGLGGDDPADRLARLGEGSDALVRLGGDAVRFVLDPIAEYLAADQLVERFGLLPADTAASAWQQWWEDLRARPEFPEAVRGFLAALNDALPAAGVPAEVADGVRAAVAQLAAAAPRVTLPRVEDEVPAHDLEIRIETRSAGEDVVLRFWLHSPGEAYPEAFHLPVGEVRWSDEIDRRLGQYRNEIVELARRGTAASADPVGFLRGMGRTLCEHLWPEGMRWHYERWRQRVRTVLILTDDPCVPWEMVVPGDDFLATEFRVTRWLTGGVPPGRELRADVLRCFAAAAPDGQRPLPDAVPETGELAQLAGRHGLTDLSPQSASAADFLAALGQPGPALWHFAGHAEPESPDGLARLVFGGPPVRPEELTGGATDALRAVRPLVFLNACDSGQVGWARVWIADCHCGAYVGPQWPVTDRAAQVFARTFYKALFARHTLGEAAAAARQAVREQFPLDPSWLGYVVYGHPSARLRLRPLSSGS